MMQDVIPLCGSISEPEDTEQRSNLCEENLCNLTEFKVVVVFASRHTQKEFTVNQLSSTSESDLRPVLLFQSFKAEARFSGSRDPTRTPDQPQSSEQLYELDPSCRHPDPA